MRTSVWVAYWTMRLIGHRVDPAKNIIYRTKNWKFVVHDGTFKFTANGYDKYRLHLHTNTASGRIERISIG